MEDALELKNVIGLSSRTANAIVWQADCKHVVHALGSTVVVRDISESSRQMFLRGHDGEVSCLALSRSGRCGPTGSIPYAIARKVWPDCAKWPVPQPAMATGCSRGPGQQRTHLSASGHEHILRTSTRAGAHPYKPAARAGVSTQARVPDTCTSELASWRQARHHLTDHAGTWRPDR